MSRSKNIAGKPNKEKGKRASQKKVAAALKKLLGRCIDEYTPEEYAKRPGKDFTRTRKMPLKDLVMFLIAREGGSITKNLIDWYPDPKKRMTASAVIQQEDKLNPKFMESLFMFFNYACKTECLNGHVKTKTMFGRRIFAADGTTLQVALDPEADTYIDNSSNVHKSKGYNLLHLNMLYDLLGCTYEYCSIVSQNDNDERGALAKMLDRHVMPKGSIVIADRGYDGVNTLEHLNRSDVDYLVRVKSHELTELKALPQEDLDVDITFEITTRQTKEDKRLVRAGKAHLLTGRSRYGKDKKNVDWDFEPRYTMTERVVRINVGTEDDPTYETLMTSLDRFQFPPDKLKELYRMRWGVETSFRELKYDEGLTDLHSRREDFVKYEIYAKLIAYNFCERVITSVVVETVEGQKYAYVPDHKTAVYILLRYLRRENAPPGIESEIARYIVPVRPGRIDTRKENRKRPPLPFTFTYRIAC